VRGVQTRGPCRRAAASVWRFECEGRTGGGATPPRGAGRETTTEESAGGGGSGNTDDGRDAGGKKPHEHGVVFHVLQRDDHEGKYFPITTFRRLTAHTRLTFLFYNQVNTKNTNFITRAKKVACAAAAKATVSLVAVLVFLATTRR